MTEAYVLSVCDEGKHQSVYMGRGMARHGVIERIVGLQAEVLYIRVAQERRKAISPDDLSGSIRIVASM